MRCEVFLVVEGRVGLRPVSLKPFPYSDSDIVLARQIYKSYGLTTVGVRRGGLLILGHDCDDGLFHGLNEYDVANLMFYHLKRALRDGDVRFT